MKLETALAHFRMLCPIGTTMTAFIEKEAAAGDRIALALMNAEATYCEMLTPRTAVEPLGDGA